jgi:hypothetical protein
VSLFVGPIPQVDPVGRGSGRAKLRLSRGSGGAARLSSQKSSLYGDSRPTGKPRPGGISSSIHRQDSSRVIVSIHVKFKVLLAL